jgi:hypothetical protein
MKEITRRLLILGALWIGIADVSTVSAQEAPAAEPGAAPKPNQAAGKGYFVEFRSRSALSYGHTFLVHGKLNAAGQIGKITKRQVAGLHPATESSIPWSIGHVVPVVSETGASDGDTEEQYVTARYRVLLSKDEYSRVSGYIAQRQKNSPMWHAVLYNCNAWIADIAKFMNLKTPDSTLLYPDQFINGIARLNGGQPKQAKPGQASAKPVAVQ